MADIGKINAVALANIAKVDAVAATAIAKINGLVFTAAAPGAFLLDTYTGAAAGYSTRRLASSATVLMRVRRTSDNVEADVGFDSNNEFGLTSPISNTSDAQSYTDFADFVDHTGTPTAAYVRYWYDQTGNGNHGDQPNAALQCNVYIAGAITILNGNPVLNPSAGSSQISTGLAADTSYKVFGVSSTYGTTDHVFLGTNNLADYFLAMESSSTNTALFSNSGASVRRNGATYSLTGKTRGDLFTDFTGQHLLYSDHDVTTTAGRPLQLGYTSGFRMLQSQEVIIYPSTSTHTVGDIETNLNSNYLIYQPTDAPTSGLLATYTGAAAAYSVRQLSDKAVIALRIRRDSDDEEINIGFDANGNLDTTAISAFCGTANGYVTRWWDQSTNGNHADQATDASQPQIYNGTAVIEENGKPLLSSGIDMQTSLLGNSTASIFAVFKAAEYRILLGDVNQGAEYLLLAQSGSSSNASGGFTNISYYLDGTSTSISSRDDAYNALNLNNQQLASFDLNSSNVGSGYDIGYSRSGTYSMYEMQELIIYHSDQSSNRTGIETNIDTYYQIPGM